MKISACQVSWAPGLQLRWFLSVHQIPQAYSCPGLLLLILPRQFLIWVFTWLILLIIMSYTRGHQVQGGLSWPDISSKAGCPLTTVTLSCHFTWFYCYPIINHYLKLNLFVYCLFLLSRICNSIWICRVLFCLFIFVSPMPRTVPSPW